MKGYNRRKIIDASIDLFAENGINNVSIERIAKEIGASRGMIYHHFKKGKNEIISAVFQIFEDCVSNNISDPREWESEDADAEQILSKLFFQFPDADAVRYRKIVHIILSEMFINEQVKDYILNKFILGREGVLAHCFSSLANNGHIAQLDAESAARFLNRLLVVNAIEDALRYPCEDIGGEHLKLMIHDCNNFIDYILARR